MELFIVTANIYLNTLDSGNDRINNIFLGLVYADTQEEAAEKVNLIYRDTNDGKALVSEKAGIDTSELNNFSLRVRSKELITNIDELLF